MAEFGYLAAMKWGQTDSMQRNGIHVRVSITATLRGSVAALALCLFLTPTATAQQSTPAAGENPRLQDALKRRENAKQQLESSKRYLEENRARVGSIEKELEKIQEERARLNKELIETGDKVKQTEAKMTVIETRLEKLEAEEAQLRGNLASQHRSISRLLSALQRMGRNPPPVMITRRSDALAMVRSAMLLARAFPSLSGEAKALAAKLNTLVTVMAGIRKESDQLRAEAENRKAEQTKLASLIQAKRQSFGDRKVELAEVRRTVQIVDGNVKNLEDLIKKLDPTISREIEIGREQEAAARRKAIAEAEAATRAAADLRQKEEEKQRKLKELQIALNVPKPPVPTVVKPEKPVEPAVVRPPAAIDLTPKGGAYIGDNARLKPAIPFHLAKGKLPLPAVGAVETSFGEDTKYGGRSKGMVIKTRYGAQITSPTDGWVVYAGKFRTYGQLLIIKAGDGYHVLLAGLSRIDVQSGQFVLAAEPVGTMKSSPGLRTGKNSPRLYVEFRKNGRPINPRPWWSASSRQRVQG